MTLPKSSLMDDPQLRRATRSLPVVFYAAAPEWPRPFLSISGPSESVIGLTPDDLVSDPQRFRERIHPDDRAQYRDRIENGSRPLQHQFRVRTSNGPYSSVIEHITRTEDDTGAVVDVGTIVTVARAGQARAPGEDTQPVDVLNAIRDAHTPVLMARLRTGEVVYQNAAAKRLIGDRPNRSTLRLSCLIREKRSRNTFLRQLLERGHVDGFEGELTIQPGDARWVSINASLTHADGDQVVVTTIVDISEKHERQCELDRNRRLATEQDRSAVVNELLGGIAHELNNPLSVIVGQILLLEEQANDQTTRERGQRIRRAAERCTRMLRSFLSIATEPRNTDNRCDPNDLLLSALDQTQASIRASGVQVELSLTPGLPYVAGDSEAHTAALSSLLSREIDLRRTTPESIQQLRLSSQFDPRTRSVSLSIDTQADGISVDPDANIYTAFQTGLADVETKRPTDFGMTVAQSTIASHGGTLAIEHAERDRAMLVVALPISVSEPQFDERDDGALIEVR
ncbi:MAG: PAS domain-containing protein [Pseudomonadota bacterium]